ncbi:MAG: Stf0 family sulfotransferase [Bacteroidota bacterium]
MTNVRKAYRIWMTPRTGSTLLCEGLAATQRAGLPNEFFNTEDLIGTHGTQDYQAFKEKIWTSGSTPNGVFGIKHSMMTGRYRTWVEHIAQMRGQTLPETFDEEVFWSDLFPACKHIFLTRRHKVRQAASWWRAIQSEQWHLRPGEKLKDSEAFYEERYDAAALQSLLQNASLRETALQEYFERYQIVPLTIVYEDMIADFTGTIRRVLAFLGLSPDSLPPIPMTLRPTATAGTEAWVQRLRLELRDPEHLIW